MVLHGIAWYFMALHGFLLQHLLVSGGQSFPCFVKILFCKLVNDFSFPDKAQFKMASALKNFSGVSLFKTKKLSFWNWKKIRIDP